MRPLFLSIEGFMAFRHRVEIDFSDKSLFVLMGPTGSGKSSVLDAISFALFGETPRMGVKDLKKLLHHDVENPRLHAHVAYAFCHYGQDYRISRQISASGKHQVEIETRANPEAEWEVHLTGKLSFFKKEIPRILGLDFEAFKKVILLPQGGFDQFLKQDGPGERRKFLMHLARLDVYDSIRVEADKHLRELSQDIALLEGERKGIGAIDGEELQARKTALKQQSQALEEQAIGLKLAEADLAQAESLWKFIQARQKLTIEQGLHSQQNAEITALEQKLKQARFLLSRSADIEHLQRAQTRLHRLAAEQLEIKQQLAELLVQEQQLRSQSQDLADRLEAKPEQEKRLRVLDALEPEIEHWQQLAEHLARLRSEKEQRNQQVRAAEYTLNESQKRVHENESSLQQLNSQIAQQNITDLEARLELLQELGPEIRQLQSSQKPELSRLINESKALKAELLAQVAEIQSLKDKLQKTTTDLETQKQVCQDSESRLENMRYQHLAEGLRTQLKPGDPCPVCLQDIVHIPALSQGLDLLQLQQQVQIEQSKKDTLEKACQGLQKEEDSLVAIYREGRKRHQDIKALIHDKEQAIDAISHALLERLGLEGTLPEWHLFKTEFDNLKLTVRQYKQSKEQIQLLEREALKLNHAVEMAQEQIRLYSEERHKHLKSLDEKESEYLHKTEHLKQSLGVESDFSAHLQTELKQIQTALTALEQLQADLTEKKRLIAQDKLTRQTRAEDLERQSQELGAESEQLQRELLESLQTEGFNSLAEAQAQMVSEEYIEQWQAKIQEHHSQTQTLLREAIQIDKDISGRSLTAPELSELQTRCQLLKTEHETLKQEVLLEEAFLKRQNDLLARTWKIIEEKQEKVTKQALYQRIHTDLGTKNLPDFLAKRVMERVIQGGSKELMNLSSQRYSFFLDEQEELVILDAWNAMEPRSVKTLSGGETFLASLALALALHDYLSAGVQLDSLFIDEGFGTLDPESLDLAAQVIEQLQMDGKCIGVITHIPELAERFETRIHVKKSETGAHLEEQV